MSARPSADAIEAARVRLSRVVVRALVDLERSAARRTAAGQEPPEPPPEEKERGAPRTTEGRPTASSSTNTHAGSHSDRRGLCLPPV
jgi:hypothetical protein